jgi:hypothetical protein
MVCLRSTSLDTVHKGDTDDDDDNDDNNNNNNLVISYHKLDLFSVRITPEVVGRMLRVIS